tara:strand:+ start:430 stop:813 length:384 start_codon:yes stop_codon:yes gene_type:complete
MTPKTLVIILLFFIVGCSVNSNIPTNKIKEKDNITHCQNEIYYSRNYNLPQLKEDLPITNFNVPFDNSLNIEHGDASSVALNTLTNIGSDNDAQLTSDITVLMIIAVYSFIFIWICVKIYKKKQKIK